MPDKPYVTLSCDEWGYMVVEPTDLSQLRYYLKCSACNENVHADDSLFLVNWTVGVRVTAYHTVCPKNGRHHYTTIAEPDVCQGCRVDEERNHD